MQLFKFEMKMRPSSSAEWAEELRGEVSETEIAGHAEQLCLLSSKNLQGVDSKNL